MFFPTLGNQATLARGGLTFLATLAAGTLWLVSDRPDGPPHLAPPLVLDPNIAPPQVLGALPRMGPALVGRVVEAREQAPFRSLDDFDARVKGIGPATMTRLRPYLRIGPDESAAADNKP